MHASKLKLLAQINCIEYIFQYLSHSLWCPFTLVSTFLPPCTLLLCNSLFIHFPHLSLRNSRGNVMIWVPSSLYCKVGNWACHSFRSLYPPSRAGLLLISSEIQRVIHPAMSALHDQPPVFLTSTVTLRTSGTHTAHNSSLYRSNQMTELILTSWQPAYINGCSQSTFQNFIWALWTSLNCLLWKLRAIFLISGGILWKCNLLTTWRFSGVRNW